MELYQMPLMQLPLPKLSKENSQILQEVGTLAQSLWSRASDTGETDSKALSKLNTAVMRSFGFEDSHLEELEKWKAQWQLRLSRGAETSEMEEEVDQTD